MQKKKIMALLTAAVLITATVFGMSALAADTTTTTPPPQQENHGQVAKVVSLSDGTLTVYLADVPDNTEGTPPETVAADSTDTTQQPPELTFLTDQTTYTISGTESITTGKDLTSAAESDLVEGTVISIVMDTDNTTVTAINIMGQ